MRYLDMGIKGAAIATVIGYASTIVYAIWFYVIKKKSSYKLELAKPDMKEIGQICFNGSSDMISNLAQGVTVLFMNHLAYRCYGEVGVSAVSVITYVQFLIMAVFMGYTSAVEPVLSYHYGSGNTEMRKKVYKISMIWSFLLGIAVGLLLLILRDQAVGIFFEKGSEFFEIAKTGYLISLPAALFVGVNIFGSGLFTAFSNGLISGLLSFIRTFVVLTACLYGLTALFGGPGLWNAWPVAELVSMAVTFVFLRKYRKNTVMLSSSITLLRKVPYKSCTALPLGHLSSLPFAASPAQKLLEDQFAEQYFLRDFYFHFRKISQNTHMSLL